MALSDYKPDPGQNLTISGIDIAEGCPPGGINNAIRQLMADLAAGVGGGLKEVTRAQYEALPEGKLTDNKAYLITDEGVIIRNGVSFGSFRAEGISPEDWEALGPEKYSNNVLYILQREAGWAGGG